MISSKNSKETLAHSKSLPQENKVKMNLYDIHSPVVEHEVGPGSYFNQDEQKHTFSKSYNKLHSVEAKKASHRYINSVHYIPGDIAPPHNKDALTANFYPQDIDRFGEPVRRKKPHINIPGPNVYISRNSLYKSGGVLDRSQRTSLLIKPKKAPGP